jgi:hypothetical protein
MCRHDELRALPLAAFIAATSWRPNVSREQDCGDGIALLFGNCTACNSTIAVETKTVAR